MNVSLQDHYLFPTGKPQTKVQWYIPYQICMVNHSDVCSTKCIQWFSQGSTRKQMVVSPWYQAIYHYNFHITQQAPMLCINKKKKISLNLSGFF